MIVREKPTARQLLFAMRGSIVPGIASRLAAVTPLSVAARNPPDMPVPYTPMLHRTADLFRLLPPFVPAGAAGPWTPPMVLIMSHTSFGLDALGDDLGSPFGSGQNALPLSAVTRGTEVDVREMLGESTLPEPLRSEGHLLP